MPAITPTVSTITIGVHTHKDLHVAVAVDAPARQMPRQRASPRPRQRRLTEHRSINPYSESQFKTLKYRPEFPDRFGSLQDARAFCAEFYRWYNTEHRHSGIAMHRPVDVHYGHAADIQAHRGRVLTAAYTAHPERFVRHPPVPLALPETAWINRPAPQEEVPGPTNSTIQLSN